MNLGTRSRDHNGEDFRSLRWNKPPAREPPEVRKVVPRVTGRGRSATAGGFHRARSVGVHVLAAGASNRSTAAASGPLATGRAATTAAYLPTLGINCQAGPGSNKGNAVARVSAVNRPAICVPESVEERSGQPAASNEWLEQQLPDRSGRFLFVPHQQAA